MTYTPHTVDTSPITLNVDLNNLVDFLAKNTHETWANERIKRGWKFGDKRDDRRKEHPCLVPYEELPEPEKEYDRMVVREMLKTLLTLGFEIKRSEKTE
jgi:ryanodine receptor 2